MWVVIIGAFVSASELELLLGSLDDNGDNQIAAKCEALALISFNKFPFFFQALSHSLSHKSRN